MNQIMRKASNFINKSLMNHFKDSAIKSAMVNGVMVSTAKIGDNYEVAILDQDTCNVVQRFTDPFFINSAFYRACEYVKVKDSILPLPDENSPGAPIGKRMVKLNRA